MGTFGASPPTALLCSIPVSLVIERHARVGSRSTPEPHHIIPPPDHGCIATRAIEQHASRQWQRRVAIGSGKGLVVHVCSPGNRKEVAPPNRPPRALLTFQAMQ